MTKKELKRIVRKLRHELKETKEDFDNLLAENVQLNEAIIEMEEDEHWGSY